MNGVVKPSKLRTGQSPITNPWASRRDRDVIKFQKRNKRCPICGDCYTRINRLKNHFIHCVQRNGNPQGFHWNDAPNEGRRIGNEQAQLYRRKVSRGDHGAESLTPEGSSDDEHQTASYEPSETSRYDRSLNSPSRSVTPSVCPNHNSDDGASPQSGTGTDSDYQGSITAGFDSEITNGYLKPLENRSSCPAEISVKLEQVSSFIYTNCHSAYDYSRIKHMSRFETHKRIHFLQTMTSKRRIVSGFYLRLHHTTEAKTISL